MPRTNPDRPATTWRYAPDPSLQPELAARRAAQFNERLTRHDDAVPGWSAAWGHLVGRIRDLSGRRAEVIVPIDTEYPALLELLALAETLTGPPDELVVMSVNQCHTNAHTLAANNQWGFATGFAARHNETFMEWRRHSWCVVPGTGRIVETTEAHFAPDTRYIGVVLDPAIFDR